MEATIKKKERKSHGDGDSDMERENSMGREIVAGSRGVHGWLTVPKQYFGSVIGSFDTLFLRIVTV